MQMPNIVVAAFITLVDDDVRLGVSARVSIVA